MLLNNVQPLDPNNIMQSLQSIFGITNLEMIVYITLFTIFAFIYKEMKAIHVQQKQKMNQDIEQMLIHYIDILNVLMKVKTSAMSSIKQEDLVVLFENVRKSYTYIDYSLLIKFESIINNTLDDEEKVNDLYDIVYKEIKELSSLKNKSLNYNRLSPAIDRFFGGIYDVILPVLSSFAVMFITGFLLISGLIEKNQIEMVGTPFTLIVFGLLVYLFAVHTAKFTPISGTLYILSVIFLFLTALFNNMSFFLCFILFLVFFGLFLQAKNKENTRLNNVKLNDD